MQLKTTGPTAYKPISIWLYIGVFMLVVQILLGGITRLTESGLSITEWNPITGVMPPANATEWQQKFDKYKTTAQFQYIHSDFTINDFKKIFFWEWLHRNWARLMGVVFIVGFVYFLVKRKFTSAMILPLIMLFVLGAIQGAVGWIMVKSGLVPERIFVGHFQLAAHFMAALLLLCYTFWFALSLSISKSSLVISKRLKSIASLIMALLFFQLIYGAFMAGLHAATAAPTWPTINGQWIPAELNRMKPSWVNWFNNKITIQFIHRTLAYLLVIITFLFWLKSLKVHGNRFFRIIRHLPFIFILLQVLLGIFTVILSPYGDNLVYFGVAHQTVAIMFLLSMLLVMFMVRKKEHRYSLFGI